jgi:hypothetical protein
MNPIKELEYLLQLTNKAGGPQESDYYQLLQAFSCAQRQKPHWTKAELHELFKEAAQHSYLGRLIDHPNLHGDYLSMYHLYTRKPVSKEPLQRAWDRFIYDLPVSYAVRNRTAWFKKVVENDLIDLDFYGGGRELNVLDVASGPGFMVDALDDVSQDNMNPEEMLGAPIELTYTGIDMDPKAIKHCEETWMKDRTFKKMSIFQKWDPDFQFHTTWSSGLFDYFNDHTFIRLFKKLLKHSSCSVAVGNLGPAHSSRGLMEMCGWNIHYRTVKQLRVLGDRIQEDFPDWNYHIETDETGIQHYLWFFIKQDKSPFLVCT